MLARQLCNPLFQLAERDVQCARQMPEAVFVLGAYIKDYDVALTEPGEQLLGGDRLQLVAHPKIRRDKA